MTDYCYDMLHGTCNNCIKWGVWKGVSGISANENREQTVEEFAFTILHIIKPRFNMDIEEKRDEFYKFLNSVPDEVKSEYKKLCE